MGEFTWHGEASVRSAGKVSGKVDPVQAKALVMSAQESGFGGLCDEYVPRGFDGDHSVTTLSIRGQMKVVINTGPSDAPAWLYKLKEQIAAFKPVQQLIGIKQDRLQNQK
jgi:hypothetical protein